MTTSKWVFSIVAVVALLLAMPLPPRVSSIAIGVPVLLLLTFVGFAAASKSGIRYFGFGGEPHGFRRAAEALGIGLALGTVLLLLLRFGIALLEPRILERLARDAEVPLERWLIILFHAPVLEELIFRLFLLSSIAWVLSRLSIFRSSGGGATAEALLVANLLSALAFAAVHLPAWYRAGPVSVSLLLSVVALNLLAGAVCGAVYLRRGLEFAMLAHLGGDIALHLGGRLLI